ncbi:hypothetical protein BDZ97DRAFT_854887 [Flammula alnicola]|nr:hypothetical protein BDZ97DRAFT_854887 [Flammula alnicola]
MPAAAHCPICLNHFPIDADKPEIVIFPCGHGFCASCTDKLFLGPRTKCPNCRKFIQRRDGHPVYLELIDSKTVFATSVMEGLDMMNPETPLVSIKKASEKLEKIAGKTPSNENMSAILRAIEDFHDRIIPLFTKVETQTQEIDGLRQDLHRSRRDRESLQSKVKKVEPLQAEVSRLKTALSETESNTQEAICLAERAKDELGKLHGTSSHWQRRAAELDQENKRFKDLLERHTNNSRLQKDKNRKLSKQLAALREQRVAEETQAMSDTAHVSVSSKTNSSSLRFERVWQEYDGDFSGHEHSRIHSSLHIIAPSPTRSPRRSYQDENAISLDFEGMPPPRFPSDWQLNDSNAGVLRKRLSNGAVVGSHRRVTNPFPIELDKKGHPTRAVQLGPRSIVHVGR